MKRFIILAIILLAFTSMPCLLADDLDLLEDLAVEESSEDLSQLSAGPQKTAASSSSGLSITFGGYLKALGYWNEERYSDELWDGYYANFAAQGHPIPADQTVNGYNNIGTRMQLKVEAFLQDRAKLFTSFNVNFNGTGSIHDTSADSYSPETGSIRLVESYVEVYQGSTTLKIGSQLVTWGFMEGIEVPTDRVNARDHSYKSTEYEDSKLASTGVLVSQRFWSNSLDLFYIPIARTNTGMEFQDYFYPEQDETVNDRMNKGKFATRLSSTLGNLDLALSYVEGVDPNPDLIPALVVVALNPLTGDPIYQVPPTGRRYNWVRSPGLDLQYNFGSLLAKASYVQYLTEDEKGDDPFIKNNWSKYVVGAEFNLFDTTVNLYAGQHIIENYPEDDLALQTNFLLGQLRERTDFVSGHINASFLTGDALNLIVLGACYWDEEGSKVQANAKATLKYKIANGLDLIFSPGYMDLMDNEFIDYQFEVKYSF